jgi:hypothetical protein
LSGRTDDEYLLFCHGAKLGESFDARMSIKI